MDRLREKVTEYYQNGFRIFPVIGKQPLVKWSELYERRPTVEELREWFGTPRDGLGIGLATGYSGIICVDADTREDARWWYQNRPKTDMMTRTNSGGHFYYRTNGVEVRNRTSVLVDGQPRKIDIRGFGGLAVAPPSPHHSGGHYEQLGGWDLGKVPVFSPDWIDTPVETRRATFSGGSAKKAALKYISHIHAHAGQNGHNETYRAAAKLLERGFNITEAHDAMMHWNETNAHPPWTEEELMHKVESAAANVKGW